MNINNMRNVVIQGQISTIKGQITTWKIYAKRTGEDASDVISALEKHIEDLGKLVQ
jgi:hypothetical protein